MSITKGRIFFKRCDLNLKMMLEGGQCFRWVRTATDKWTGVFADRVWTLKQFEDHFDFQSVSGTTKELPNVETNSNNTESIELTKILSEYLRLDDPLQSYYKEWSQKDSNFESAAVQCYGIRMLKQDPVENVFSFICSSNNNIIRISSMVEKMCKMYGKKIAEFEDKCYYSFPEISALSLSSVEGELRKAGFGYRAKFIQKTAEQLMTLGGVEWLEGLKTIGYKEAKVQLMKLQGIGAKVADCICLMSLGHLEAVPVDTHVFQIASQVYLLHLKKIKTVTDRVYNEIGDYFRELYGPYAGWAHTILFCADLKMFKEDTLEKPRKRKNGLTTREEPKEDPVPVKFVGTLPLTKYDLNLRITLNCGQTYRWKEIGNDVWRGVFANRIWTLTQGPEQVDYEMWECPQPSNLPKNGLSKIPKKETDPEKLLRDYFRLDEPLADFYRRWSDLDGHFMEVARNFYGLRMTRQDIVENLFAFVCSTNNTIARITTMVESLCSMYGEKIGELDGKVYFGSPCVSSLSSDGVVAQLCSASFGFRAKYVVESAKYIMKNGGHDWFLSLQKLGYEEAKKELMKLPGVGAKVADCICLTALDHLNTIPVDTHVFQIAKKYYLPHLQSKKTVSEKAYNEIGEHFRKLFGHYAGWAHTVLFCSDLRIHNTCQNSSTKNKSPKKTLYKCK